MKPPNISNEELTYILKSLVKFPSENPPGKTKEIIDFLISEVFKEEEGFHNEIVSYSNKNINLHNLVTKIGYGKDKIILSGHFDVVPSGDPSKWKYSPYSAKISNGRLYGRGSSDMKSGLTMLIGVMKNLNKNPEFLKNYTYVFAGTADEEIGMTGSLTLFNKGIMKNAKLLVIAEPTMLNIGIAEKGLLWIKLRIFGKSAHGSMPNKGINSIECAFKLIPYLYKFISVKEENRILGSSTLNIGKIYGGTVINVVPDKTIVELDYRLIPEQDPEEILNQIKKIKVYPCSLDLEITKKLRALQTDATLPFIQNLKTISKSKLIGLPYATDAAHLIDPIQPLPFVIYGPGNPDVVHAIDEYVNLDSVFKSTEFLTQALLQTYLK